MKILIAADGSEYTRRMLAYVAAHDEWLGPRHRYTVLHVPVVPSSRAGSAEPEVARKFHEAEADADTVLRPIRAFLERQGIEASYVHKAGPPADVIARTAEEGHCDLIVMGSHGHGEVAHLVLGSVASGVLARCKTPVLLVR